MTSKFISIRLRCKNVGHDAACLERVWKFGLRAVNSLHKHLPLALSPNTQLYERGILHAFCFTGNWPPYMINQELPEHITL
jgi:hypothetical protein